MITYSLAAVHFPEVDNNGALPSKRPGLHWLGSKAEDALNHDQWPSHERNVSALTGYLILAQPRSVN